MVQNRDGEITIPGQDMITIRANRPLCLGGRGLSR